MTASSAMPGTDEHPEVAEISALTEGLLAPDRSAALRAHLTDCVLCHEVRTSLEEIRGALGTLPGPPRMPEDVSSRIDAALAAEALLEATGSPTAYAPASATARAVAHRHSSAPTSPPSRGSGHVSRETRRPGGPSTPSGPGRAPGRWSRRRRSLLAVSGTLAVVALGVVLLPSMLGGSEEKVESSGASETGSSATSGGLSADGLEAQVRSLLAEAGDPAAEGTFEAPVDSPEVEAQDRSEAPLAGKDSGVSTAVPLCISAGIERSDPPLAATAETYEGATAYLVVLPHAAGKGERVDVYVVDAGCVDSSPSTPGQILLMRTYER